jgi:hypothetical protein
LTLKNNCTTSTLTFRVSTDWSCAASSVELVRGTELVFDVGPVEDVTGGAGGAGIPCATAATDKVAARVSVTRAGKTTADNPAARHDLQSNLGISVFIPRLC